MVLKYLLKCTFLSLNLNNTKDKNVICQINIKSSYTKEMKKTLKEKLLEKILAIKRIFKQKMQLNLNLKIKN